MAGRNKIITVFGGSGFLGRHLVRRLVRLDGAVVRIACRHPGRAGFLKPAGEVGQVVPIAVDITSDEQVAAAVAGADSVINLIGILFESGRWSFTAVQAEAAGRIARAAKAAGAARLIQLSAIGADPASRSAYARSKALGEQAVLAAFPEATILRPSIVFGPEDGFFNRFASMAVISPFLPLIGGGGTRFQPVYVGDVADAAMAALADASTCGRTFELGGPNIYSFKELMVRVLQEIRRPRMLLTIPWWLAGIQAWVFERLPKPMLTRDQVELLKSDNVVAAGCPGLRDLGIVPTSIEAVLPGYLRRFRPGGHYSASQNA
ncbi:MAG: complex I NDUFA9 subunit family protein [Rhodospirillaceae bacterium]